MTTIFLIILLITQVISFYFITLLYMKLSKFDDLERKQNKLMKEMDDAIAVYLTEIKDENEKFIEQLTVQIGEQEQKVSTSNRFEEVVMEEQEEQKSAPVVIPQQTMRHYARKSYENVVQIEEEAVEDIKEAPPTESILTEIDDDRTRAIQLSKAGLSIEEIAKELDKGTTEIELILKFS